MLEGDHWPGRLSFEFVLCERERNSAANVFIDRVTIVMSSGRKKNLLKKCNYLYINALNHINQQW